EPGHGARRARPSAAPPGEGAHRGEAMNDDEGGRCEAAKESGMKSHQWMRRALSDHRMDDPAVKEIDVLREQHPGFTFFDLGQEIIDAEAREERLHDLAHVGAEARAHEHVTRRLDVIAAEVRALRHRCDAQSAPDPTALLD